MKVTIYILMTILSNVIINSYSFKGTGFNKYGQKCNKKLVSLFPNKVLNSVTNRFCILL